MSSDSNNPKRVEDRRAFPRIASDMAVEIVGAKGVFSSRSYDVSRVGLQLVCDPPTAAHIFPDGFEAAAGELELDLRVALPASSGGSIVSVRCLVVRTFQPAENEIRAGLKFLSFEGDSEDRLEHYVLSVMQF